MFVLRLIIEFFITFLQCHFVSYNLLSRLISSSHFHSDLISAKTWDTFTKLKCCHMFKVIKEIRISCKNLLTNDDSPEIKSHKNYSIPHPSSFSEELVCSILWNDFSDIRNVRNRNDEDRTVASENWNENSERQHKIHPQIKMNSSQNENKSKEIRKFPITVDWKLEKKKKTNFSKKITKENLC